MDVSDQFSAGSQCAHKMTNFRALGWRYPYTCSIRLSFDVTQNFTEANNNYIVINVNIPPVLVPPGSQNAPFQEMILCEYNSNLQATGNICPVRLDGNASSGYFATAKPSQFRAGYTYAGEMTFQVK